MDAQHDWLEICYGNVDKDNQSQAIAREPSQYGVHFNVKHPQYSQPKSINLVLKLSKHVDYTLICNRVQRHILFVTNPSATKS